MRRYEDVYRVYLTQRLPCIIRLDGKSFHTLTQHFIKPFDESFADTMLSAARKLCEEIQGAKLVYWQSDELSILLTDYDTLTTQAWFDKNVQKMVSISSSMMTHWFNYYLKLHKVGVSRIGYFDSRVFILPKEEVCNYFIDRQQDATRNSINAVGQRYFSHKSLHGLSTKQVQEKLFQEEQVNWNNISTWQKRGACLFRDEKGYWKQDKEIPKFTEDRNYVNRFVNIEEENANQIQNKNKEEEKKSSN